MASHILGEKRDHRTSSTIIGHQEHAAKAKDTNNIDFSNLVRTTHVVPWAQTGARGHFGNTGHPPTPQTPYHPTGCFIGIWILETDSRLNFREESFWIGPGPLSSCVVAVVLLVSENETWLFYTFCTQSKHI